MTTDDGLGVTSDEPRRQGVERQGVERQGVVGDPALDDWLDDEAAIEWFPGPDSPGQAAGGDRFSRGRGAKGHADVDLIARRRVAGLVVAAVVVFAVVALAIVVFGGGGGSKTPPAVSTPTTPVKSTTTTPAQGHATTKPSTKSAASLRVALPGGKLLRAGDTGAAVKKLQQALKKLGYTPGAVDGSFGPATKQAVVSFQRTSALSADGIVGPTTVAKLNAALAAAAG